MRRLRHAVLAALLLGAPAMAGADALAPGPYARIVVIEPHPGKAQAFRDGYRRHLEWHRRANDPWTWHGWTFVLGERLGAFMDGTFGHAAEAFDHAVDPAGDRADNAANVTPHADFSSHGVYERLDGLGAGEPLPDASPYLAMTTYRVEPGREAAFEALVAERACVRESGARFTWMRLVIGGEVPQYLLFRPASSFGEAARVGDFFGAGGACESAASLAGTVRAVRHELLARQADLSYAP